MYFYICHRSRIWEPSSPCVLFASAYGDYLCGDHVTPSGSEGYDGLTVVKKVRRDIARNALQRGVPMYSNLTSIAVREALGIG